MFDKFVSPSSELRATRMRVDCGLDWTRTLSGVVVCMDAHRHSRQFGEEVRRDAAK
jgi:hypothetical protein